nr:MAG TPA: major capsid protein [Caudoviricetes sp.]
MSNKPDFSGYCTKNDILCTDGVYIRKGAFKAQDGEQVTLVYMHNHTNIDNVLGHAILENRDDGVYAYGYFNDSPAGESAKKAVIHGDLNAMSIWANDLVKKGKDVLHGTIREISLVLAGANKGAFIDTVLAHGQEVDNEGIVYCNSAITVENNDIEHSDDESDDNNKSDQQAEKPKTIGEIYNNMTPEQKEVVDALVAQAVEDNTKAQAEVKHSDLEGENMKTNVFDKDTQQHSENVLTHDQMSTIIKDGKRYGSLKESFLEHKAAYGIDQIDWLFPEDHLIDNAPRWINQDTGWVTKVMSKVHHIPFAKVKTMFADITADEARAKGYTKGKKKIEEVFTLLKRSTSPQTVYKKQKMDRDDITDITTFDVVSWLKMEMRGKLNEELARAFLIGDGRSSASDDKIREDNIRPIWTDDNLFVIHHVFDPGTTTAEEAEAFIDAAIIAREDYTGSGNPDLYLSESMLTACLLLKDANRRRIYKDKTELATAMCVNEIITVPPMKGLKRTVTGTDNDGTFNLKGIIVNLNDYAVGADKGGSVNMFEDFDIDYNQEKYLIETRCSGAIYVPKSAIVLETKAA